MIDLIPSRFLAARVQDDSLRQEGSSGGICRFLIRTLLESGEVDGVVCVVTSDSETLYEYGTVRLENCGDIAKSVYFFIDPRPFLEKIPREQLSRLAFVGLPCMVHWVHERFLPFRYTIGILCNRAKESDLLTRLFPLETLEKADFRTGTKPHNQVLEVTTKSGETHRSELGKYFFEDSMTCSFCQNCTFSYVPTAEITVMDAWLPRFQTPEGTNLCIVRNRKIAEILNSPDVWHEEITEKDILTASPIARKRLRGKML